MADKRYDHILYEYFEQKNGAVVLLSNDQNFKRTLSSTIFKIIGTKRDCLWTYEGVQPALKRLKDCDANKIETVVFIERLINDRPSTDTIITLKNLLPDLRIIVLVSETKRENIAYFYEIGVNNVISKPASMNNIIEKMAFTIKPQGKLSEYMSIGKRFLAVGKHSEALQVSSKILEIKPGSPAGLMLQGDVHLDKGDHDKAVASYLEAHESSHLYLEPLKKLAAAFNGVDDEQHLFYLGKLDRLSPLNIERKTDMGRIHVKHDRMEKAEKFFDQAMDIATKEAMSLIGSVAEQISEAVGNASPEMAEKYLTKVIESRKSNLTKDDITLFNKRGIALRGQGKWQKAIENYSHALTISAQDEGLLYNMGMAYYDGRKHREAANCFEKALKINPDFYKQSEVVSINLGKVYSDLRQMERALEFFKTAHKLNPDNQTSRTRYETLKEALET